ncbi:Uncharacterised protein [Mycobacteroides abscessus subsp. abscessus]|nr:Uncharacterised protein [Mycobacteroides abscessus subsp. abscessus]
MVSSAVCAYFFTTSLIAFADLCSVLKSSSAARALATAASLDAPSQPRFPFPRKSEKALRALSMFALICFHFSASSWAPWTLESLTRLYTSMYSNPSPNTSSVTFIAFFSKSPIFERSELRFGSSILRT